VKAIHQPPSTRLVDRLRQHPDGKPSAPRRSHAARKVLSTSLQALALVSIARQIGPRRARRVAAVAAKAYLEHLRHGGRSRKRR
jgi:hypothetical protein